MKILLTGGSGQLGHALSPLLADMAIVHAPARQQLDLSNAAQLRQCIQEFRPDLIVNPAAYTAVDLAESETEQARAINAVAPAIMAEEARKLGAGLIHYSTDYVYSGDKADAAGAWQAYVEDDATGPLNVYGKSKLSGEQAIVASGCQHLILRTSWVYSLHGKNFFLTMLKLARERSQLRVVNDQWGAPNSAAWLAEASCHIIRQWQQADDKANWWKEHGGIYHLSASGKASWFDFAAAIVALAAQQGKLGKDVPDIQGIPASEYVTPAKRPHNSLLDTHKLQNAFQLDIPDWHTCLQATMQAVPPFTQKAQANQHAGR